MGHRADKIAELQNCKSKAERGSSSDKISLDAKILLFSIETVILRLEVLLRWATTVLVFCDMSEEQGLAKTRGQR
jgi:hypothetical protein